MRRIDETAMKPVFRPDSIALPVKRGFRLKIVIGTLLTIPV